MDRMPNEKNRRFIALFTHPQTHQINFYRSLTPINDIPFGRYQTWSPTDEIDFFKNLKWISQRVDAIAMEDRRMAYQ